MQLCVSIPYISFCLFMSLPLSMTLLLSCNSNTPRAHRVSLEHMAHLLSSECHTTDTTLCYKTRPCGTVCITCTTVGVPSLCMELHTRHTPLRTSSPEPCVVTNTTAKHQSHRTISLCGNIPHYINLVGRELQQLLGGGSAVSHMSKAMNLSANIKVYYFHTQLSK